MSARATNAILPTRRSLRVLGAGLTLGLATSALAPTSGCLIPDYCILIYAHGTDYCTWLDNAMMWPIGQPDLAEPVPVFDDDPGPTGCGCFNAAERKILDYGVPQQQYSEMFAAIEAAAREECHSSVPAGFDHNCFITEGPNASVPGPADNPTIFNGGPGLCWGECHYTNPPPGKECPSLNPYECEDYLDGDEGNPDEVEGDSDGTESGGETSGDETSSDGIIAADHIVCTGSSCDVDENLVAMLYDHPDMLMTESTRLVYDTSMNRFILTEVEPGSLAATLGLQTGDRIEQVNGTTIDSVDAALQCMAEADTTRHFDLRITRARQWLAFTYHVVP